MSMIQKVCVAPLRGRLLYRAKSGFVLAQLMHLSLRVTRVTEFALASSLLQPTVLLLATVLLLGRAAEGEAAPLGGAGGPHREVPGEGGHIRAQLLNFYFVG